MHLKCVGYNLKVSYCCDVYIIVLVQTVFHTRCVDKFVLYLCTKFQISDACSSLVISLKMKITVSSWSPSYFIFWKHYLTKSCVMFQDLVLPYIISSSKASGCSSNPMSQAYVTVMLLILSVGN